VLAETPKARRGVGWGCPSLRREKGLGRGLDPLPENVLSFDLKKSQNGAFWCSTYAGFNGRNKDALQDQEAIDQEAIASYCLTLATPMSD